MYFLRAYEAASDLPIAVRDAHASEHLMRLISEILSEYPGCDRIDVYLGVSKLFTVEGRDR